MNDRCDLQAWIGAEVSFLIPAFHPTYLFAMRVIAVEDAGVWIACKELTDSIVEKRYGAAELEGLQDIAAFIPFSQIACILIGQHQQPPRLKVLSRDTPSNEKDSNA